MGECYRIMLKHLSCQHLRDCENQEFKASLNFRERLCLNFPQIMEWHLKKPATEMWDKCSRQGLELGTGWDREDRQSAQGTGQGLGGHGSSFL